MMKSRLALNKILLLAALGAMMFVFTSAPDPVFAQGKPDFAGKKEKAEKGDRGRSDAARDLARERGKGKKIGLDKDRGTKDGIDKKKKKKKKKKNKREKNNKGKN